MTKWTTLILTFLVFIMFQNMDWVDIRQLAPEKPLEGAGSSLFPNDLRGASSVQGVAERVLEHSFGEELHALEKELLEKGRLWGVALFAKDEYLHASSVDSENSTTDSYVTRSPGATRSPASIHLMDPRRVRFYVLDSRSWYLDYNMPDQTLLLNYKTELSSRLALHSTYESREQKTSLWFDYKW